jgi:acetylornithine deacetylase/succinyl-diaminopimelate desuccinylase-like protein
MNPSHAEVDRDLERSIEEVKRLVAQPSVSSTGEGVEACAELCRELLEQHGFAGAVHQTDGSPVVVGERGRGPRTLLLYCHYDTEAPGDLDLWTSPPFEPELRDGRLYGRGTEDDKGHIVSRLAAVSAYVRAHGEPPFRIVFLIEGEEEVGSPSLTAFVRAERERLRADGCIWEWGTVDHDDRPIFILGLRGYLSVELAVGTANADLHSGLQSYLPNAAWRLVWALSTLKDPAEHVLIDGFYERVLAPTPRQLELLRALPDTEAADKRLYGVRELAGDFTAEAARTAVFMPTCSINGVTAGFQGTGSMAVLPRRATAKLDFRLVPDQHPEEVLAQLRRHLEARGFGDVRVRSIGGLRHPATVDPELPFVRTVIDSASAVYTQPPVVHPLIGGSGPFDLVVGELDTPVVCGVGIDRPGTLGHAPDEHIYVEELARGTKHMASLLEQLAALWG